MIIPTVTNTPSTHEMVFNTYDRPRVERQRRRMAEAEVARERTRTSAIERGEHLCAVEMGHDGKRNDLGSDYEKR